MANEWISVNGKFACYNSSQPKWWALVQQNLYNIGDIVSITFTVDGLNQGKLVIDSLKGKPEFYESGTYTIVGEATVNHLIFYGDELNGEIFNGCLTNISSIKVPFYEIKDLAGNVVYQQADETQISTFGTFIQYQIDWSIIEDGCYQISITSGGFEYLSGCLNVKTQHDCTILLSWTNNESAFGFNYDPLSFMPKLRVRAKLRNPNYPKNKETFEDNAGNFTILKSKTAKEYTLNIAEVPEYIHDAIAIGIEHDDLYLDSVKYTNPDGDYSPIWRNSTNLAPANIVLRKKQLLINSNC